MKFVTGIPAKPNSARFYWNNHNSRGEGGGGALRRHQRTAELTKIEEPSF